MDSTNPEPAPERRRRTRLSALPPLSAGERRRDWLGGLGWRLRRWTGFLVVCALLAPAGYVFLVLTGTVRPPAAFKSRDLKYREEFERTRPEYAAARERFERQPSGFDPREIEAPKYPAEMVEAAARFLRALPDLKRNDDIRGPDDPAIQGSSIYTYILRPAGPDRAARLDALEARAASIGAEATKALLDLTSMPDFDPEVLDAAAVLPELLFRRGGKFTRGPAFLRGGRIELFQWGVPLLLIRSAGAARAGRTAEALEAAAALTRCARSGSFPADTYEPAMLFATAIRLHAEIAAGSRDPEPLRAWLRLWGEERNRWSTGPPVRPAPLNQTLSMARLMAHAGISAEIHPGMAGREVVSRVHEKAWRYGSGTFLPHWRQTLGKTGDYEDQERGLNWLRQVAFHYGAPLTPRTPWEWRQRLSPGPGYSVEPGPSFAVWVQANPVRVLVFADLLTIMAAVRLRELERGGKTASQDELVPDYLPAPLPDRCDPMGRPYFFFLGLACSREPPGIRRGRDPARRLPLLAAANGIGMFGRDLSEPPSWETGP